MFSSKGLGIVAVGVMASLPAFAGHQADYDYAQVVDVNPLMREVRVVVPREECFSETRYVPVNARVERPAAGQMILGGLIGAVVGHQVGNSRDARRTGTVAGAVIGTAIGHDVAQRNAGYRGGELRAVEAQRCEVREETRIEQQIDGYEVTYRYAGRMYTTRMPYEPGPRIRVRVAVEPAA